MKQTEQKTLRWGYSTGACAAAVATAAWLRLTRPETPLPAIPMLFLDGRERILPLLEPDEGPHGCHPQGRRRRPGLHARRDPVWEHAKMLGFRRTERRLYVKRGRRYGHPARRGGRRAVYPPRTGLRTGQVGHQHRPAPDESRRTCTTQGSTPDAGCWKSAWRTGRSWQNTPSTRSSALSAGSRSLGRPGSCGPTATKPILKPCGFA